jgi:cellulose synthase/poly-beta-1,6-N-acetylglucosamine synthase-like glycosyltransferase
MGDAMKHLQRAVGLCILGLAAFTAAIIWFEIAARNQNPVSSWNQVDVLGVWHLFYSTDPPNVRIVVIALLFAVLFASGVASLEHWVLTRSRRSHDPGSMPLAPRLVMAATRGKFAGPIRVTVLIPAHNEAERLPATLTSLAAQSAPPERIIVVADNCTDATVDVGRAAGVEVVESIDNRDKKAGALNQALRWLVPEQGDNDLVMIMDADTTLDEGFLEAARRRFADDRGLMAVGGLFYGEEGCGVIGQFQRNEYVRYSRDLARRQGKVFVLTGTASLFRPLALRTVAAERGRILPGPPGDVYDTFALTEDNELTLALKTLGALMISPPQCTVITEVMPTWRTLWNQRLRWQRGALENLGTYGLTLATLRYWTQQLGISYGVIAFAAYFLLIAAMAISADNWIWYPFWLGVGGLFVMERVVTVWKGGWRARILAALLLPELCYAMFLNAVYVRGVIDIAFGKRAQWGGLNPPNDDPVVVSG